MKYAITCKVTAGGFRHERTVRVDTSTAPPALDDSRRRHVAQAYAREIIAGQIGALAEDVTVLAVSREEG